MTDEDKVKQKEKSVGRRVELSDFDYATEDDEKDHDEYMQLEIQKAIRFEEIQWDAICAYDELQQTTTCYLPHVSKWINWYMRYAERDWKKDVYVPPRIYLNRFVIQYEIDTKHDWIAREEWFN